MAIVVEHVAPNITKEEDERRNKELEEILSLILKAQVTVKRED